MTHQRILFPYKIDFVHYTPKDKILDNILKDSIEHKHVELFKWLISDSLRFPNIVIPKYSKAQEIAIDILKYINIWRSDRETTYLNCPEMLVTAAKFGCIEIIKWLRQKGCPWDEYAFKYAIQNDQLNVVKWLYENKCPRHTWMCIDTAAEHGRLEILKWFRLINGEHWNWQQSDDIWCSSAAENGHLDVLIYLHDNGCKADTVSCYTSATRGGHLEILRWLDKNGCPKDESVFAHAAEQGRLEIVRYLHETGCPWDQWACFYAVGGSDEDNNLELLRYLHENGCDWDELTCRKAAEQGHFRVLQYLHENGCPWDDIVCDGAVSHGHLDVLKYLHENGCYWDQRVYLRANRPECLGVLEYLRDNDADIKNETDRNGHYHILKLVCQSKI